MDSIKSTGTQNIIHNISETKTVKEATAEISTSDSFVKSFKTDNLANYKNVATIKRQRNSYTKKMTRKDWADSAVFYLVLGAYGALAGAVVGAGVALICAAKIAQTTAIFAGAGAIGLPRALDTYRHNE